MRGSEEERDFSFELLCIIRVHHGTALKKKIMLSENDCLPEIDSCVMWTREIVLFADQETRFLSAKYFNFFVSFPVTQFKLIN